MTDRENGAFVATFTISLLATAGLPITKPMAAWNSVIRRYEIVPRHLVTVCMRCGAEACVRDEGSERRSFEGRHGGVNMRKGIIN